MAEETQSLANRWVPTFLSSLLPPRLRQALFLRIFEYVKSGATLVQMAGTSDLITFFEIDKESLFVIPTPAHPFEMRPTPAKFVSQH